LYESFLSEVPILASLQSQERAKIADVLESRTYAKDETVIVEGEAGEEFFLVESGTAVAIKRGVDGEETVLKTYGKGDYFGGESWFVAEFERVACLCSLVLTPDRDAITSRFVLTGNRTSAPYQSAPSSDCPSYKCERRKTARGSIGRAGIHETAWTCQRHHGEVGRGEVRAGIEVEVRRIRCRWILVVSGMLKWLVTFGLYEIGNRTICMTRILNVFPYMVGG
jgi:hypothetical protein